jgi:hypothetical protein
MQPTNACAQSTASLRLNSLGYYHFVSWQYSVL